jgi:hypothetical protein
MLAEAQIKFHNVYGCSLLGQRFERRNIYKANRKATILYKTGHVFEESDGGKIEHIMKRMK